MDILTYTLLKSKLGAKADLIDGKIPAEQLPSYVDDVVEYATLADFPEEGEESKIYIALDSGLTYRWSGSQYVQIGGQDLSNYYTKDETDVLLDDKQDVIGDLDTIRSGASAGSTSVQEDNNLSDTDILAAWKLSAIKKGDIVNLEGVDGDFLVIKTNNELITLLRKADNNSLTCKYPTATIEFSEGVFGLKYGDSTLEKMYLNSIDWGGMGFYGSLPSAIKNAIIETERVQDLWHWANPGTEPYPGITFGSTYVAWKDPVTVSAPTRKIFLLTLQEVFDYLELIPGDVYPGVSFGTGSLWTSSAMAATDRTWVISGGTLSTGLTWQDLKLCPAFNIKLAEVNFTKKEV